MEAAPRRILLGGLGLIAILAVIAAVLVVTLAPKNAGLLLTICIGTLIIVLVAELVTILVTRAPAPPQPAEPQ